MEILRRPDHETTRRRYTYDNQGNITRIHADSKLVASYAYDELGRLVKDNDVEITYDTTGNILQKGTNTYHYNGDKLMIYNGQKFEYDQSATQPSTATHH